MTFFLQKSLASGPIRFAVSPRRTLEEIDDDPSLSTGPNGEFVRHRPDSFFFEASAPVVGVADIPRPKSAASAPFWRSVVDGTGRGYAFLGLMILGGLLILLGIAVVAQGRPQGWVEIILGLIMIAVPIVLTANRRRQFRQQEERERLAREEAERKHRAMLVSYGEYLDRVRRHPDDGTIEDLRREREGIELPYEVWSPHGKATVLQIGLQKLHELGPNRSREVAALMTKVADAAGLTPADDFATKTALYGVLVWHLLADDRLGEAQEKTLKEVRKGFDIWDRDIPTEAQAVIEFKRLRGINRNRLPRRAAAIKLIIHEYGMHSERGHMIDLVRDRKRNTESYAEGSACGVFVTNKRLVIEGRRKIELGLTKVDDVEVDVDANVVTVTGSTLKEPLRFRVQEPIYTAALMEIAATLDERPKGFA